MDDKVFDLRNAIYVRTVPRKGRCVFANISFKIGDVVEHAPTWGFDDVQRKLLDNTQLFEYYFVRHEKEFQTGYVVFGWTSIVNHSSNPNTKIMWTDSASGMWATIVALKDIKVNDEITHCYTNISAYPLAINFID